MDSSHALTFARIFNDQPGYPLGRVIAATRGRATDFPLSVSRRNRIETLVQSELSIPLVDSIDQLVSMVDGVIITSCDGRCHSSEARPVLATRIPVFIDKPLCPSWSEADRLVAVARAQGCPLFSASALRFRPTLPPSKDRYELAVRVPRVKEPHHPDLSWHGIHGVESIFAHFGRGCVTVSRRRDESTDVTTATWQDGRIARIHRTYDAEAKEFPVSCAGQSPITGFSYVPLVRMISKFIVTGIPPVSLDETVEILKVIDAADLSADRNGASISLCDLPAIGEGENRLPLFA